MKLRNKPIPKKLLTTPSKLINEFIDFINSTSGEYVTQFSVQTALTFFGHLYSRQYIGESGVSTGIYSMLVGQSGIGKNYCKESVLGFEELHTNILSGATSDSGLFTALVRNPVLMMVSDEIGDKFVSTNELNKSFWRMVRETYNTKQLSESGYSGRVNGEITEKEKSYNIKRPCLSILGMTTPGQLSLGLTDSDIESGTLNRFTIIDAYPDEIEDNNNTLQSSPPLILKSKLLKYSSLFAEFGQKSFSKDPSLKMIPFEKGKDQELRKLNRRLLLDKNSKYTVRSVEKARRIALILAISMGLDYIPNEVIDWALEYEIYWVYNIKKMSDSTNQTTYSTDVKKFTEKLKSNKEGIEIWKVNKFFRESIGIDQYKRDQLIGDLTNDKLIEIIDGPKNLKNGKSKKLMFYIGDKRK